MSVAGRLGSISTRMLIILALAFLLIILMVYLVIETQGKPRIMEMTSETVVETGNEAINSIMASINHVDGLAKACLLYTSPSPRD